MPVAMHPPLHAAVHMEHSPALHLAIFTAFWTAAWVLAPSKLPRSAELPAGLIPFAAFGLRVFAGFFENVPQDDPVRSAVAPLVGWVAGRAGALPYQIVLDGTIILGIVWFAAAFEIPRSTRRASWWLIPAAGAAGIIAEIAGVSDAAWEAARRLGPPLAGAAVGGVAAALVATLPGELGDRRRRRSAALLGIGVPLAAAAAWGVRAGVTAAIANPPAWLPRAAVMATAALAGIAVYAASDLGRWRSRALLAGAVAVPAGALALA